jgi:predicted O-methyltransferase YrrM
MGKYLINCTLIFAASLLLTSGRESDESPLISGPFQNETELDRRVKEFLNSNQYRWRDMNVPMSDGQLLYDIIVKNNYKTAVEIGTSTGHSGIWIAWALSKTGGKLITIELDASRHREALANFEKVGLSKYIDAGWEMHTTWYLKLTGPLIFVFSDADKDWYINYFKSLDPKLRTGGCFVSHNVSQRSNYSYYQYVSSLPNYNSSIDNRGGGMAISYKTANR